MNSDGRPVSFNLPPTAAPLCVAVSRCPPDQLPCSTSQTLEPLPADLPTLEDTDSELDNTTISAPQGLSVAFPTNSAERKRNAKRAAKLRGEEWVVKTQPKHVEAHFDDCGEDISAISDETYFADEDSDTSDDELTFEESLLSFALLGPDNDGLNCLPPHV